MNKTIRLVMFHFLLLVSLKSTADTCPRVEQINFALPPAGWTFLIGPSDWSLEHYTFSAAIHSLNGNFYYQHVICRYDACPSSFCPAFTLISNNTYPEPSVAISPWNQRSVLKYTLTCMPDDHDPAHCRFQ